MRSAGRSPIGLTTLVICLVALPIVAEAHSPINGLGTFYNYMLHPLVVPPHALILIGSALMLGQQGRSRARIGLMALCIAFAAGQVGAKAFAVDGVREQVLLLGALIIGSAVSIDRPMPTPLIALAAAGVGLAIGLDSTIDIAGQRESLLGIAGLSVGVLYLVIVIAGSTVGFTKLWQRVGVRIVGSWIVAASVMVLTLSFADTSHRVIASMAFGL